MNWPPRLDHGPAKFKLDGPIEPHSINVNRVEIAGKLSAGAAREANDARISPRTFSTKRAIG